MTASPFNEIFPARNILCFTVKKTTPSDYWWVVDAVLQLQFLADEQYRALLCSLYQTWQGTFCIDGH